MSVLNANHLSCAYKKTLEFDPFLTGIKLFNYKLLVGGQAKLDINALSLSRHNLLSFTHFSSVEDCGEYQGVASNSVSVVNSSCAILDFQCQY